MAEGNRTIWTLLRWVGVVLCVIGGLMYGRRLLFRLMWEIESLFIYVLVGLGVLLLVAAWVMEKKADRG